MKPNIFSSIVLNRLARKNPFFTQLQAMPAIQLDACQFRRQYKRNKPEWDAALAFLMNNDLSTIELGRHNITERTFAAVSEYTTKSENQFEAHKDYIDIQIIVRGQEIIEVAPLSKVGEVTVPYSAEKDIEFYASAENVDEILVSPEVFCILFPNEAHKPCLTYETPSEIRKVVVKIPFAK